ncbi:MAG: ABC transporter ATP-binding protein [Lachnospiraceae bacterium]|nr:ABC transporter ATP-binding protein [Lachnospiraceae bacterium]
MSLLSAKGISAGYGNRTVINDISFDIEAGELVGIVGSNGCGKTTLLKSVCNNLAHSGSCVIDDITVEKSSAKDIAAVCSYIPQKSGINIDISVLDVVLMGYNPHLGFLEYPNKDMKEKAMNVLQQVGLSGFEDRNFLSLSEGQKQLCVLARAIVSDCKVFLMDEPESALDFSVRYKILDFLKEMLEVNKKSALVTLHDISLALNYCDKLLLVNNGTVEAIAEPKKDDLSSLEEKLGKLFGKVSLREVADSKGKKSLVMIRES